MRRLYCTSAYFCFVADVHDKVTRSYNMSRIRAKNTKPEMLVRKFLHSQGFRYTLHNRKLPGKPDIVLPKYKTVIFIHGCFFHVHNCKDFKWPKSQKQFWRKKLEGNVARDLRNKKSIKKLGWRIIHLWECNLRPAKSEKTLSLLLKKFL